MKICIPIKEKRQKTVQKRLLEASKKADCAEIWLDQIKDLDLKNLLSKRPLPILCACKKPIEKGAFKGEYEAQASLLIKAIKNGTDYIDIPLYMPENLNKKIVQNAKKEGCRVIISHHDFKKTVSYKFLLKKAEKIKKRGADVVKLACRANSLQDAVNLIAVGKVLSAQKTPHVLIGMGKKGILTRILTPTLGGEMMFAVLDQKKKTAPGQLSVSDLKKAWSWLTLPLTPKQQ